MKLFFENWRDRRLISSKRREIANTNKTYGRLVKQAKLEGKPRQEIDELGEERYHETRLPYEEIEIIRSRLIVRQADSYSIPVPRSDEAAWEMSDWLGQRYLREEVAARLQLEINRERRAAHGQSVAWLAGLTGLLGAATGLVALLLDKTP